MNMTEQQVESLVRETMAFFKMSHIPLKIRWSNGYTRCMGRAKMNAAKTFFEVSFSVKLWERATPEQQRNTVIHEVCHIVCFVKCPHAKGHGIEWKKLMVEAGEIPLRTHSVNRTGLKRTNEKAFCYCRCGKRVISSNRATRIKNKTSQYHCSVCGYLVALVPYHQSKV